MGVENLGNQEAPEQKPKAPEVTEAEKQREQKIQNEESSWGSAEALFADDEAPETDKKDMKEVTATIGATLIDGDYKIHPSRQPKNATMKLSFSTAAKSDVSERLMRVLGTKASLKDQMERIHQETNADPEAVKLKILVVFDNKVDANLERAYHVDIRPTEDGKKVRATMLDWDGVARIWDLEMPEDGNYEMMARTLINQHIAPTIKDDYER